MSKVGAGNAYVTWYTNTAGSGFPGMAASLIQSINAGGSLDAFVAKLNAAGTALVYSTYLGAVALTSAPGPRSIRPAPPI